jgi:hypothetical protein
MNAERDAGMIALLILAGVRELLQKRWMRQAACRKCSMTESS